RQRLTVVRRLWGHDSIGPSGVLLQSIARTTFPISPPPTSQASGRVSFRSICPAGTSLPTTLSRLMPPVRLFTVVWLPFFPRRGRGRSSLSSAKVPNALRRNPGGVCSSRQHLSTLSSAARTPFRLTRDQRVQ